VYVEDIVITGERHKGIDSLQKHFQTKDLGSLKYLGIEVATSTNGIFLSQRKYTLDLLSEAGMLGCMSIDSLMDMNMKLLRGQGELLKDVRRYMRLAGKLNYLMMIKLDITFTHNIVSQFLSALKNTHLEAIMRVLRYLKKALWRGLLYSDYGHTRVTGFSDTD